MSQVQPRIVLCILHDQPAEVGKLCASASGFDYDNEYSGQGADDRVSLAFKLSDNTARPTLRAADFDAVRGHQGVAYVLSPRLTAETSLDCAARSLDFVSRAFAIGARAVKCESSGLAHGREAWLDLHRRCIDPKRRDAALYLRVGPAADWG